MDWVQDEVHQRAVGNNHWGCLEETRVPFHGSDLWELEDSDHFFPQVLILQAPLFLI